MYIYMCVYTYIHAYIHTYSRGRNILETQQNKYRTTRFLLGHNLYQTNKVYSLRNNPTLMLGTKLVYSRMCGCV